MGNRLLQEMECVLRRALAENGINIFSEDDQDKPLNLDSLSFISVIVSLEKLGIFIPDDFLIENPKSFNEFLSFLLNIKKEL